jgi:protein ImuB
MIVCLLFPQPVKLEPLAEACYRFTPRMALRHTGEDASNSLSSSEALFLHLTEEPSNLLILKLRSLCGRFGLKDHQVAWSTAASKALALARYQSQQGHWSFRKVETLPLDSFSDLLSPFKSDSDLSRNINTTVLLLQKLGLTTLGDFMKLPLAGLSSRFGEAALKVQNILKDNFEEPWPGLVLPEKIIEEVDLDAQDLLVRLETIEPLLFLMKGVVDRVCARLYGRNQRTTQVQIDFESKRSSLGRETSSETRSWRISFPVAQNSSPVIFSILKEKIYFELQKAPLQSSISVLRFSVLETVPGGARQKDFFHRREEEQEMWSSLVARLSQKLGESRVFQAAPISRHLPEGAWESHLTGLSEVNGRAETLITDDIPKRPTRLLPLPRLLKKEGEWLVDSLLRKKWRVISWDGPERVSGEWWTPKPFARDYFRVLTEAGELLWIFVFQEKVFLHGFFD